MRSRLRKSAVVFTVAAAMASQPLSTTAVAQPALVAPGAPMRAFPVEAPETLELLTGQTLTVPHDAWASTCSQGPTGTLHLPGQAPQRVMLTASHCVNTMPNLPEIKNEFLVPVGSEYRRIGERVASNHVKPEAMNLSAPMETIRTADWGVISIDAELTDTSLTHSRAYDGAVTGEPVQLTHIRDFRTLSPGEVSADNFGQPICKDGATTGRSCGTQIGRTRNGVYSWGLNYVQGDSGGVNFDPNDGAVIGVTSMVLGPLGKAQPADRIIEDAYGIPDGHVNDAFTITNSTAPRADFTTSGAEEQRVEAEIERLNPDVTPPVPRDELRKAVGEAQHEAANFAQQAARGEFDPAEVNQAVSHHSERIGYWGGAFIADEIIKALP